MCPTRSPLNERSAEVNTSMMLPRRPIVTAADRSEMNAGGSGLTMDLGCVLRVHTGAISQASRTGLESNSVEPCALDGLGVVLAPSLAHVCHPATVQPLPRVDARDWAVFPVAPTHRIPLQYTYAHARHVSARDALETKKVACQPRGTHARCAHQLAVLVSPSTPPPPPSGSIATLWLLCTETL